MNIALLIIGLLLALGGVGYFIYFLRGIVKDPLKVVLEKKEVVVYFSLVLFIAVGFTLLTLSLFLFHPAWASITSYSEHLFAGVSIHYPYQIAFALIGIFFFALTNALLWSSFVLHYWKNKLKDPFKKLFSYLLWGDIPFAFLFFLMWTEGLAPYLTYPLINGFSMTGTGWLWTTSADIGGYKPLHIAFYGILILFGVCVAYWVCDHKFYQEFHKHGILDSLVIIAFPSGVIGARIWYVVGNYSREFAPQVAAGDVGSMFRIWDGGLTILGGAFAGALAGLLFLHFRRKYVNLRWAMDVCLPSVLLAQAVGRWGNFFNSEVYGFTVNYQNGWSWLPNWLLLQMNTNNGGGYLDAGMIHVPLFLVESLLSIAGYFLLVYGVGKGLKKYIVPGDLAGGYFLWYGIVRIIMEPMRDSAFNMGTDNAWSICNSIVYIVLGLGSITFLHLHDYLQAKGRSPLPFFLSFFFALGGLFFPFMMSLTASSGSGTSVHFIEGYQGFALLFSGKAPALLVAFIFACLSVLGYGISLFLYYVKKERLLFPVLYGAMGLSALAALMFLLGKSWTALPSSIEGVSVNYSLSYGFVLLSLSLLLALAMALSVIWVEKEKKKMAEIALANGETNSAKGM